MNKLPFFRRSEAGISLIIVLACIALLTVLIVAFLAGAGVELKSSKLYANGSSARSLAQSSVDIVMGEIRDATQTMDSTGNNPAAWACQPGTIRTYKNDATTDRWFKLYSDTVMSGTGSFPGAGSFTSWATDTAQWTDLNAPVTVNVSISGTLTPINDYPIVDGGTTGQPDVLTASLTDSLGTSIPSGAKSYAGPATGTYPVPSTYSNSTHEAIDGFYVSSSNPTVSGGNPLPMPVRWLYVLSSGAVVAPTATVGAGAIATVPGASSSNPIVGRIAFWTDDETSKLNVNTAAEGTYWDTPRVSSSQDGALASNQAQQNEYQRYPGHPAMVCLSTVLGPEAGVTGSFGALTGASGLAEKIFPMVPRTGSGSVSSEEGTIANNASTRYATTGPQPTLSIPTNRLYDTPDEFLFQPSLNTSTPPTRQLNSALSATSVVSATTLEQDKFFLTASSRAPDLNLFSQPRVSIWPVFLGTATDTAGLHSTAFDQLSAFCSTLNNHFYYFQRQDPTSPTNDLPQTLVTDDIGLDRNRRLLEYLRNLTSQAIPGFGGIFKTKYGTLNRDQILTEIFDYIRSVNLDDPNLQTAPSSPYNYKTNVSEVIYSMGNGQVVPIIDGLTGNPPLNPTRGFGRFPTVSGAFILIMATPVYGPYVYPAAPPIIANEVALQAAVFVNLFTPAMGYTNLKPLLGMKVTGLGNFTWSGTDSFGNPATYSNSTGPNMGFPDPAYAVPINYFASGDAGFGGTVDFRQFCLGAIYGATTTFPYVPGPSSAATSMIPGGLHPYQLISYPMIFQTGGTHQATFSINGANVTINLIPPTPYTSPDTNPLTANATPNLVTIPSSQYVQTVTLPFPNISPMNIPTLSKNSVSDQGSTPTYYNFQNLLGPQPSTIPALIAPRLKAAGNSGYVINAFIDNTDVVEAMVPSTGDIRLIMPMKTITAGTGTTTPGVSGAYYMKHPNWGQQFAHSLRTSDDEPFYGATPGRLVGSAAYYHSISTGTYNNNYYVSSATPSNATWTTDSSVVPTVSGVTGDWDNGVSYWADGPFISKSDEGDTFPSIYGLPYFYYNEAGMFSTTTTYAGAGTTVFSPNRMIPSPGVFGSLPTGVWSSPPTPWQTLLFRPDPNAGTASAVIGSQSPPDYLLMDLFNMPVCEPYSITEPLSTAGRINMNYQIMPFTYINRDTGIRAILKSEKIIAIPTSQASSYKEPFTPNSVSTGSGYTFRLGIDADQTLQGFLNRFSTGDIFRSPAEICKLWLVPAGQGLTLGTSDTTNTTTMNAWWSNNLLTGDNSKERPYATIYPRLTTQSNTFTVHMRVQTLKKVPGTNAGQWVDGTDQVTGEYRGSELVERYVDPNDTTLPDFASPGNTATIDANYKFRVITSRQFAP